MSEIWAEVKRKWTESKYFIAVVFVFLTVAIFLLTTSDGQKRLRQIIRSLQKRREDELYEIQEKQNQKEKEKKDLEKKHEKILEEIGKEYKIGKENAKKEYDKKVKKILKQTKKDPSQLSKRLADEFGLDYKEGK